MQCNVLLTQKEASTLPSLNSSHTSNRPTPPLVSCCNRWLSTPTRCLHLFNIQRYNNKKTISGRSIKFPASFLPLWTGHRSKLLCAYTGCFSGRSPLKVCHHPTRLLSSPPSLVPWHAFGQAYFSVITILTNRNAIQRTVILRCCFSFSRARAVVHHL